jgi:hypothetical protein
MLLGLLAVFAVGFIATWPAQHDAGLAAHLPLFAAQWYPLSVDLLILISVAGVFVLRGRDDAGKRYCLGVATAYTAASLLINYLHGLGWFQPNAAGVRQTPPPILVAVIVVTAAGAVPVGTHMMTKVAQVAFPNTATPNRSKDPRPAATIPPQPEVPAAAAGRVNGGRLPKDDVIARVREAFDHGEQPTAQQIMEQYGWGKRVSEYIRAEAVRLHAVA